MDAIKKILVPTDFSAPADEAFPARLEEARLLFERMLGYANHLGLYAEQTGSSGEALGNFPQAFTHLALISAAFNLDRALGAS
jgi:GH15 family glucan-1,4-alpha-glucosidase